MPMTHLLVAALVVPLADVVGWFPVLQAEVAASAAIVAMPSRTRPGRRDILAMCFLLVEARKSISKMGVRYIRQGRINHHVWVTTPGGGS